MDGLVTNSPAHPFLDGTVKKLFIDGQAVEAVSGRTFDPLNPATGQVIAQVAESGEADIDLAGAAARMKRVGVELGGQSPDIVFADADLDAAVNTIEDAIRLGNQTSYGLGGAVWTQNVSTAHRMADAIRAWMVWINCQGVTEPTMTYEGLGMSGYGAKGGRRHTDEYLYSKTVWLKI